MGWAHYSFLNTRAHLSVQRCTRGLPDAAASEISGEPGEESTAIAQAVKESGVLYVVHLSSYGAQVPEGPRASRGTVFFGTKAERDRRLERLAPACCVFHGKQSEGNWNNPWDGRY
jgi:hypothetical protein